MNYNNLQNVATIFLGLFLVQVVFEGKSPIYENKITFLSLDIFLSSLLKKIPKKKIVATLLKLLAHYEHASAAANPIAKTEDSHQEKSN